MSTKERSAKRETKPLSVRFTDSEINELDALRGELSRGAFIRLAVFEAPHDEPRASYIAKLVVEDVRVLRRVLETLNARLAVLDGHTPLNFRKR